MTDPYSVLGVSPSASDDEIKEAYRNLAKKYHPDQYAESPLKELADEKMKQINEAYDEITNQRRANGGSSYSSNRHSGGYNTVNDSNSGFADVRRLINTNRIADAEEVLNGVPDDRRSAEWYFLKGSVLFRKGWLDEARTHFERAVQMEPNNMEYRNAMNQVTNQGRGVYGGYNPRQGNAGGCNSCDVCSSLICADCCCECMGGDLISCC